MAEAGTSGIQPEACGGLYGALGVGRDASAEGLKKAYRECAKRWHPDKTAHLSADEKAAADAKFDAAREAFEILSDPQRRAIYDGTGETSGGATRHETASYLSEVFGDLVALSPFCGTLWIELLFSDDEPQKTTVNASPSKVGGKAGYTTSESFARAAEGEDPPLETNELIDDDLPTQTSRSGIGVRVAQHLYASAAYSIMPNGTGNEDGVGKLHGSKRLLQYQREREAVLAQGLRESLFVLSGNNLSEEEDCMIKDRLMASASDAAADSRPRGLRLLKAAAQGLSASSSWSLTGPRAVHAAKAQWALARAAGAATWAIVGGSEEAASEHASEAVTRLSEADVLSTCFAAKAALLDGVDANTRTAVQRRLPQLAEALNSAADTAEARAVEMAAAQNARACKPGAPPRHKLKMPGGMLFLGSAAPRDGEADGDLVPHGDGRLFFADGSCHDGHFDGGRADGRGRLFGGAAAQEGCVWEGVWKQNRRTGAFEVWDSKGILWLERYDETGKKVARKKAPAAGNESGAMLQEIKEPLPAVPCSRCGKRFQMRWGSVQWCRSHKDGLWQGDKSAWSCCGATVKDSPGCEVLAHQAADE